MGFNSGLKGLSGMLCGPTVVVGDVEKKESHASAGINSRVGYCNTHALEA